MRTEEQVLYEFEKLGYKYERDGKGNIYILDKDGNQIIYINKKEKYYFFKANVLINMKLAFLLFSII